MWEVREETKKQVERTESSHVSKMKQTGKTVLKKKKKGKTVLKKKSFQSPEVFCMPYKQERGRGNRKKHLSAKSIW